MVYINIGFYRLRAGRYAEIPHIHKILCAKDISRQNTRADQNQFALQTARRTDKKSGYTVQKGITKSPRKEDTI